MLAKQIQLLIKLAIARLLFTGVVTGTVGNLVTLTRTGETVPDTQSYPRLASYAAPVAGDEVLVLAVGIGYLVVGKVVR